MEESFKGWPPCDVCGKPVDKRQGVLSVNPKEAEAEPGCCTGGLRVTSFREFLDEPGPVEWLWSHCRCMPRRNVVWMEAERFDTVAKMFDHTLHLSEKNWYQATNWRDTVLRFYDLPDA